MPQGQATDTATDVGGGSKFIPLTAADREANAHATDIIDDIVSAQADGGDNFQPRQQPKGEDDVTAKRQPPRPRIDDKRNAIIARFRGIRSQPQAEQTHDIDALASTGLPPEFEQYREPDGNAEDAAAERSRAIRDGQDDAGADDQRQAAPPKKVKLRVNHQDVEMDMDDVIAHAQKSMAADNILDSAKSKARELDDIIAQARNRVARPDPASHQTGQDRSQQAEPASQDQGNNGESHTSDDDGFSQLVETMQFGDVRDAAPLLRDTIDRAVDRAADRKVTVKMQQNRMNDEAARTGVILEKFNTDHPELQKDRSAQAVMKQYVYETQVDDLAAIGVTMESLQASVGHALSPGDIAQAHQFYRSEGYKLKKPEVMLEDAHDHMLGWRGTPKTKDATTPPVNGRQNGSVPPRIAVNVDREERRQQITPAPNRTSPPQQQRREIAPQRRPAGDVVLRMKQQRDLARGRSLGA